jgi:hypothetical protein
MKRIWGVEPASERTVQDILDWPRVLQVHGEAIKNGHRAVRADEKGTLTSSLSAR